MPPAVTALDHLVLTVADIDRTVAFYTEVLGMRAIRFTPAGGAPRSALQFGTQKINLHQAGAEFEPKAATPSPGSADICFLSDTGLREWAEHLETCGVTVEDGPVPRTGAVGPINSIYIRDPDGNLIEIANQA